MALFTAEAGGTPICTFAADDLEEAEDLADAEKEDWAEIGAMPIDASVSVRQANSEEMMLWTEMRDEAIQNAEVEEAEEHIIAFHVHASYPDDSAAE
jgi:uracil DNA glycosylase